MRNVSEATKITKVVGKVLGVLEKEQLTDEQIASVMKATEETLGIKPPHPPIPPIPSIPLDVATKEEN